MAKRPTKVQSEDVDDYRDETFEEEGQSESGDDFKLSPADFEDLFILPGDWNVSIVRQYLDDRIDLDPDFQRRGVWNKVAKSRFIESLFLGIPIPQILLAQDKNTQSDFIVLDGKQRLLTIKEFFEGHFEDGDTFSLRGLEALRNLNGKSWSTISKDTKLSKALENANVRVATVKGWRNDEVLYEIFYRLNAGSVKLSPMELRMALIRGDFLKHIIQWTEQMNELHALLRLKSPDKRMADVELTVRYLAFREKSIEYRGNLKKFLDDYCKSQPEEIDVEALNKKLVTFERAVGAARKIFGPRGACRRWLPDEERFDTRFNRAIFDVVVGSLANLAFRKWALENPEKVLTAFKQVAANEDFSSAVESTTKSIGATTNRFSIWYAKATKISGVELALPNIAPLKE